MTGLVRGGWLSYGLAILVVALDQISKASILGGPHLLAGESANLWGPLRLTLVWNPGVAYGLFRSDAQWPRWALAGFELAVAIALAIWARRAEKPMTALFIGLVMGGAVGNLIDRVVRGSVVDFVDVQSLHFPWIFNVADSAITVGIAVLVIESLTSPAKAPP